MLLDLSGSTQKKRGRDDRGRAEVSLISSASGQNFAVAFTGNTARSLNFATDKIALKKETEKVKKSAATQLFTIDVHALDDWTRSVTRAAIVC